MENLKNLAKTFSGAPSTPRMPVMFVGHGNPMNAITDNTFARVWEKFGRELPMPKAIVCVSAHWQSRGTKVTAMEHPKTIHDFGGFPDELFAVQYPAPGSPTFANEIAKLTKKTIEFDHEWGLDHGTWSVLVRMYPAATIPVLQLSLDVHLTPQQHSELAKDLSLLRNRGVLIVGSGNIVHNLRRMNMEGAPFDWAVEFDATSKRLIESRDITSLANYPSLGTAAQMAIPTDEHYLPMIYALSMAEKNESLTFFNEQIDLGSVSMRSFVVGG
ncbi:MAG: 4,5-DOPA dioxygenase extradiol [Candidatus Kapabacteria bacterium]|nr:4,5-DOPA dioxygenase extradiol [Candidatus Kapabacteria bacterium]